MINVLNAMRARTRHALTLSAAVLAFAAMVAPARAAPKLEYFHLVKGFDAEAKNSYGVAAGNGWSKPNRWGQYTAYLMATNAKGQRTFRIEHYLPMLGLNMAQGSTMYLLEGSARALLIDTANPATATDGVNDLKTVVRYLLAHDNDGKLKSHPLDFVVANTHNHPDHIGENWRMSDRTVYYMDGDWPDKAPPNYVPIREGGGPTSHGNGQAVGEIDLGHRLLKAIAVPPHTDGSTAYFDSENDLIVTGDALGSGWPSLGRGPITQFVQTINHVEELTRSHPDIAVLPAHFYQIGAWDRSTPPLSARPLGRQYILDLQAAANGIIAGTVIGEPPFRYGRDTVWGGIGSAAIMYSVDHLARPGEVIPPYHAIRIPGHKFRGQWLADMPEPALHRVSLFTAEFYLIRDTSGVSMFLLRGTKGALLIGTGNGEPGLETMVRSLVGDVPLEVALLSDEASQTSGLAQLSPARVYAGAGSAHAGATILQNGAVIDLGTDKAGRPLVLEAQNLSLPGQPHLSLLAKSDEQLFVGSFLGKPGDPAGISIQNPVDYQVQLGNWMGRTLGRFDVLYLASAPSWYTSPDYLDQLQLVLERTHSPGGPVQVDTSKAGVTQYISNGNSDVRATIVVPAQLDSTPNPTPR